MERKMFEVEVSTTATGDICIEGGYDIEESILFYFTQSKPKC